MKSVYIYSNGCSSNMLDGERMAQYFELNGYAPTADPSTADIIVVNTCAFEAASEADSIAKIKELQANRKARMVVSGCLPAVNKQRLDQVFQGDTFIPKNEETWGRLDDIIQARVSIAEVKDPSVLSHRWPDWKLIGKYKAFKENPEHKAITGYDENVYHIRISSGCTGKCSFCAIRFARGCIKSRSVEEIVAIFREGLQKGFRSFKIWGDDVGDYGLDINTDLSVLLKEILKIQEDFTLEVLATNPRRFLELYDVLLPSLEDKRLKWLNISVQSGSEKILKLMKREIDIEALTRALKDLKKRAPHLIIRAHYIVGFPSEGWRDFFSTMMITFKTHIYKFIVLKFDPKPNTEAAMLPNQISNFRKNLYYLLMRAWGKFWSLVLEDGMTY